MAKQYTRFNDIQDPVFKEIVRSAYLMVCQEEGIEPDLTNIKVKRQDADDNDDDYGVISIDDSGIVEFEENPHISIIPEQEITEEDNIIAFSLDALNILLEICDKNDYHIFNHIECDNMFTEDIIDSLFCFKLSNELFEFIKENCPVLIKFAEIDDDEIYDIDDLRKDLLQIHNFLND